MVIDERKRNRDLAIRLLAGLAAILMRHAHGMRTVFWKSGIVDDPDLDRPMPLDPRQRVFAHLLQSGCIRSLSFAQKVQQRLVLGAGLSGHRLRLPL